MGLKVPQTVYNFSATSNDYLGVASEAIADAASGKITINGGINGSQSGLTIGSEYYTDQSGNIGTSGYCVPGPSQYVWYV